VNKGNFMVFISIDHTEAVPFIWKPRGSDNLTSYSERTTMNVSSKPSHANANAKSMPSKQRMQRSKA
jgi:hypothetical protein